MPHFHNPKGHVDGWWRNQALDGNGAPRALNLGLVSLAPGSARFVDAKTVDRSGGAFDNAKSAGLVAGPFATEAQATAPAAKSAPAPKPEPTPPAAEDDEPAPAPAPKSEESAPVAEETSSTAPKKSEGDKKRKG
jgi:hypothetical protein